MNRILEVDAERKFARVQPGLVLDTLQRHIKPHNLMFAPDPSTHSRCTIGGMIGNNSCGTHSLLGGKTVDNVEELTILLYDGTQMKVSATTEAEIDFIIRAGGRRGEIYRSLKSIRDRNAERIRGGYPQFHAAYQGTTLTNFFPSMASTWPARWWARKEHAP